MYFCENLNLVSFQPAKPAQYPVEHEQDLCLNKKRFKLFLGPAVSDTVSMFSCSADGNYEVTLMTKATVFYNGLVIWKPPAVYKSSCAIDVEFFPYDVQTCVLKLGSWTYDGFKVRVVFYFVVIVLEKFDFF